MNEVFRPRSQLQDSQHELNTEMWLAAPEQMQIYKTMFTSSSFKEQPSLDWTWNSHDLNSGGGDCLYIVTRREVLRKT